MSVAMVWSGDWSFNSVKNCYQGGKGVADTHLEKLLSDGEVELYVCLRLAESCLCLRDCAPFDGERLCGVKVCP